MASEPRTIWDEFFSVLRTEISFKLVDNVLLKAESASQSLRRYDTPSLSK